MNSKVLQDKIQGIESHQIEMRLLRKGDKNSETVPSGGSCQSSVSLKHYDQLLCDLKCPGCTVRLQPPIWICETGHSICRICHFTLNACPICEKKMTDIRSHTLERLSNKFQFPCKNLRNGCNVRLPMELMKWHEEKCIFKKTSCFMGKVWHDCTWVGREDEWLSHCKEKHNQKILQNQENFELVWNCNTLSNNAGPVLTYYLIQNYGETFNFYQIYELKQASLIWTVMLADYKETILDKHLHSDLPKFSFEIEFFRKDDSRFLLIQRFPVHYADSETLLDDGKCLKIPLKDIQQFLDEEKNLFYRVRINTCKVKKDRWDQLLDKAKIKIRGDSEDSKFSLFDSLEENEPYIHNDEDFNATFEPEAATFQATRDNDLLKQILQREFPADPATIPLIPHAPYNKPPRKSLENKFPAERDIASHRNATKF